MKLKTVTIDGKVYGELIDDKPVYVADDGKDVPFDVVHSINTISRLNGEAKGHREAKEAAEAKLATFKGIDDPTAAVKALATIKNIDEGQLIAAGKVEEIKQAAQKAAEDRVAAANVANAKALEEVTKRATTLEGELYNEKIGGSFARSKFISDRVAIPSDFVQARFGQQFKIEDGKIVAYGADGNKLYSRAKPGSLAEFEEAIELLVDASPSRDHILKGTGGGSGSRNGNGETGGKTITRAAFDALDHAARAAKMADKVVVVD